VCCRFARALYSAHHIGHPILAVFGNLGCPREACHKGELGNRRLPESPMLQHFPCTIQRGLVALSEDPAANGFNCKQEVCKPRVPGSGCKPTSESLVCMEPALPPSFLLVTSEEHAQCTTCHKLQGIIVDSSQTLDVRKDTGWAHECEFDARRRLAPALWRLWAGASTAVTEWAPVGQVHLFNWFVDAPLHFSALLSTPFLRSSTSLFAYHLSPFYCSSFSLRLSPSWFSVSDR